MSEILLVTEGHPYEREPFHAVFDEMAGVNWTHIEHPVAQMHFDPELTGKYDAYVMYDMPGISFSPPQSPVFHEPDWDYKKRFMAMLEAGQGMVFLHHAIAGWPAWPEYADILGGRFLYEPAEMRGVPRQDSGYRHGVTHEIGVVTDHPITAGIPKTFEITDELYLYEVFEEDVTPLLRSHHDFSDDTNFYSASKAVHGEMYSNENWEHEPGSNLVGWCKTFGNSRIAYLQCGDDAIAYANPHFRQLIANAIEWVSSS